MQISHLRFLRKFLSFDRSRVFNVTIYYQKYRITIVTIYIIIYTHCLIITRGIAGFEGKLCMHLRWK